MNLPFLVIGKVIVNIPTITYIDLRKYERLSGTPAVARIGQGVRQITMHFAGGSQLDLKAEDADGFYNTVCLPSMSGLTI